MLLTLDELLSSEIFVYYKHSFSQYKGFYSKIYYALLQKLYVYMLNQNH